MHNARTIVHGFLRRARLTLIDRALRKVHSALAYKHFRKSLKNWNLATLECTYYKSLFACFHSFIWIIARNYACERKTIFQPRFRIDVNLSRGLCKMHSVAQRTNARRGIVICVLRRKVRERGRLIIPYLEPGRPVSFSLSVVTHVTRSDTRVY